MSHQRLTEIIADLDTRRSYELTGSEVQADEVGFFPSRVEDTSHILLPLGDISDDQRRELESFIGESEDDVYVLGKDEDPVDFAVRIREHITGETLGVAVYTRATQDFLRTVQQSPDNYTSGDVSRLFAQFRSHLPAYESAIVYDPKNLLDQSVLESLGIQLQVTDDLEEFQECLANCVGTYAIAVVDDDVSSNLASISSGAKQSRKSLCLVTDDLGRIDGATIGMPAEYFAVSSFSNFARQMEELKSTTATTDPSKDSTSLLERSYWDAVFNSNKTATVASFMAKLIGVAQSRKTHAPLSPTEQSLISELKYRGRFLHHVYSIRDPVIGDWFMKQAADPAKARYLTREGLVYDAFRAKNNGEVGRTIGRISIPSRSELWREGETCYLLNQAVVGDNIQGLDQVLSQTLDLLEKETEPTNRLPIQNQLMGILDAYADHIARSLVFASLLDRNPQQGDIYLVDSHWPEGEHDRAGYILRRIQTKFFGSKGKDIHPFEGGLSLVLDDTEIQTLSADQSAITAIANEISGLSPGIYTDRADANLRFDSESGTMHGVDWDQIRDLPTPYELATAVRTGNRIPHSVKVVPAKPVSVNAHCVFKAGEEVSARRYLYANVAAKINEFYDGLRDNHSTALLLGGCHIQDYWSFEKWCDLVVNDRAMIGVGTNIQRGGYASQTPEQCITIASDTLTAAIEGNQNLIGLATEDKPRITFQDSKMVEHLKRVSETYVKVQQYLAEADPQRLVRS